MRVEKEQRPRSASEGAAKITGGRSESSLAAPSDVALLARRHRFALYVLAERSDHRIVGQVFTSLPAASRKVERTRARGLHATMTLVELVPVGLELDSATVPSSVVDLFESGVV